VNEKEKQSLSEKTRQSKAAVARFGVQDRPSFDSQDTLNPVLLASLTSFRTKHDINAEIDTSSETLKLGRNRSLVFHRDTVADQVAVTKKALAYAEVIITNNCRNAAAKQARGERRGNDVMAQIPFEYVVEDFFDLLLPPGSLSQLHLALVPVSFHDLSYVCISET
jgi:hypothetical protein